MGDYSDLSKGARYNDLCGVENDGQYLGGNQPNGTIEDTARETYLQPDINCPAPGCPPQLDKLNIEGWKVTGINGFLASLRGSPSSFRSKLKDRDFLVLIQGLSNLKVFKLLDIEFEIVTYEKILQYLKDNDRKMELQE